MYAMTLGASILYTFTEATREFEWADVQWLAKFGYEIVVDIEGTWAPLILAGDKFAAVVVPTLEVVYL